MILCSMDRKKKEKKKRYGKNLIRRERERKIVVLIR